MGTLRSLGALARAVGPLVAASGEGSGPGGCRPGAEATRRLRDAFPRHALGAGHLGPWVGPAAWGRRCSGAGGLRHRPGRLSTAYWLAGARACFTVCAGLFLLPFLLLRNLRPPAHTAPKAKAE